MNSIEQHDPTGRACALAGRVARGDAQADGSECAACLADIAQDHGQSLQQHLLDEQRGLVRMAGFKAAQAHVEHDAGRERHWRQYAERALLDRRDTLVQFALGWSEAMIPGGTA